MEHKSLILGEVMQDIWPGDLLLWEVSGWNPVNFAIGVFGRSPIKHAAIVGCNYESVEVVQWHGGRSVPLEDCVREESGRIRWYRPDSVRWTDWDCDKTLTAAYKTIGTRYGYWNIIRVGLLHFPIVRFFSFGLLKQLTDDNLEDGSLPFCSQAVSSWYRAGGVDPVPHLADRATEPGDLDRSLFFNYQGNLYIVA